jgi:4-amino-4-deoxy-L-arabinose transferase-like glycosyltransferase
MVLAVGLLFAGLGNIPFIDRDEGEYATVALEMIQRGDYVVPHVNGRLYFEKPPLFYWLMAISFEVFGQNETAGRLPSAVSGLALVALLGWFGNRRGGQNFGLLTTALASTSFMIIMLSRVALLDTLLTLWTTSSLVMFFEGYLAAPEHERRYFYGGWATMSLAFLTKGPVGVVVIVSALVLLAVLNRNFLATLKRIRIIEGVGIFILISGPWFLLAGLREGQALWREFFWDQHFTRFTKVVLGHGAPVWFYLPVLAVMVWPWFFFALPAWWRGLRENGRIKRATDASAHFDFFLGIWLLTSLFFFSITQTKQPNYIMPAVPAVILLAARWWQHRLGGEETGRSEKVMVYGLTGLLGGILALFFMVTKMLLPWALELAQAETRPDSFEYAFQPHWPDLGWGTVLVGVLVGLATLAALVLVGQKRPGASLAAWGAAAVALIAGLTHLTAPPAFEYLQSPGRQLAYETRTMMEPGDVLTTYGLYKPTLWFYTGRVIKKIDADKIEELREYLASEEHVYILSRLSLLPRLEVESDFRLLKVEGGYLLGDNRRAVP